MFSPTIDKHIYDCQDFVAVSGVEAGATVKVYREDKARGNPFWGEAQAAGESVIVSPKKGKLKKGEKLFAVAYLGADQSNPSETVTVQALPPIPKPLTSLTLYEGGTCLYAWGVLPGSTVKVWSGADALGEERTYLNWVFFLPLNRPLKTADAVQLEASVCGQDSGPTAPLPKPVPPRGSGPYAESLPPPQVWPPPLPCMQVAGLHGLLPGAHFQVFDQAKGQAEPGSVVYDLCAPELSIPVLLAKKAEEGDQIRAWQEFPALNLKSDFGKPVTVERPKELAAPWIQRPIYAGESMVYLHRLYPSARVEIEVTKNSKKVFGASRTFQQENRFDLGMKLDGDCMVRACQSLCGQWSAWDEAPVLAFKEKVPAPIVEEPLYACANYVRIANWQKGARVIVEVDGSYAGDAKAPLVHVAPQLRAGQKVVAYQLMGDVPSLPSAKVTVKDIDAPPKPVLSLPKDYRSVLVSNLLPGAQVEIKQKNLTLACKEATAPVESIYLDIEPWPGMEIYARQSLCLKYAESKPLTVLGKIAVEKITPNVDPKYSSIPRYYPYGVLIYETLTVHIKTQLPVKKDLKVKLTLSDVNIAKILGTDEQTIAAGGSATSFSLLAADTGATYLTLEAQDYQQAFEASGWSILPDNRYELMVQGVISVSPSTKTLKQGESFDLAIQAEPRPPDGKIMLQNWPKPPASYNTKVIDLPPNKTLTTAKYEALKTGANVAQTLEVIATRAILDGTPPPPGANNDWLTLRYNMELARYKQAVCEVTVEPLPKPGPPPGESTATITFGAVWFQYLQATKMSEIDGTITKIINNNNVNITIGRVGHPTFIYVGAKSETSLKWPGTNILNYWYVELDPKGTAGPPQLDLIFYYKLG